MPHEDEEKLIEKLREKLGAHKKIDERAELEKLFGKAAPSPENKLREKLVVPKIKIGDEINLSIEKISYGGEGIGRYNQLVIFVPDTLPGDTWKIRITAMSDPVRAEKLQLISPSCDRIKPKCQYHDDCGACQLQSLTYTAQLIAKKTMIQDILHTIANVDVHIHHIIPCSAPFEYRIRSRLKFGSVLGKTVVGFFAPQSHRLIPVENCPILHPALNRTLKLLSDLLPAPGTAPLPTEADLTCNYDASEIAIHLYSNDELLYLPDLCERLRLNEPRIRGISSETKTNHYIESEVPVVQHKIGSNVYKAPARCFFQANRYLHKTFLDQMIMISSPASNDVVLDLYCGVGFFSIPLARYVKRIIGVDVDRNAIECAQSNADLNHVKAEFICAGDRLFFEDPVVNATDFSLVVADPPRSGMSHELMHELIKRKIPKLLYISCNPATFSRDLNKLIQADYRLRVLQPMDMFPNTYHVELIAYLTHRFTSRQAASAVMPDLR